MFTKIFKEIPTHIKRTDGSDTFIFKYADGRKFTVHFTTFGWDVETTCEYSSDLDAVQALDTMLEREIDNYRESITGLKANLSGILNDVYVKINQCRIMGDDLIDAICCDTYDTLIRRLMTCRKIAKTLQTRELKFEELISICNEFRAAKRKALNNIVASEPSFSELKNNKNCTVSNDKTHIHLQVDFIDSGETLLDLLNDILSKGGPYED